MGKNILADPKLAPADVLCAVIKTGRNNLENVLSDLDDEIEDAREDLDDADDKEQEKLDEKIRLLQEKRKEFEGLGQVEQLEPVFVVPNEVYERYRSDTDVQFLLSSALLDRLRKQVGDEKVDLHVFRIQVLPKDTDQFWRDPKPTSKKVPRKPPKGKKALHPLSSLKEQFKKALAD